MHGTHNMIGIYKITNPNGKVYVGQSTNIAYRFLLYKNLNCKQQKKLYNSLIKYGVENHCFEIIIECELNQLNELERYYQDLYNVLIDGLNLRLTKSTDRNGYFSEETKNRMSIAQTGKKGTEQKKEKCRQRMIGTESFFKGKKHSEKSLALISYRNKGNNNRGKVVIDLLSGVFYNSAEEVANLYGYNPYTLRNKLNGFRSNNTKFMYV